MNYGIKEDVKNQPWEDTEKKLSSKRDSNPRPSVFSNGWFFKSYFIPFII